MDRRYCVMEESEDEQPKAACRKFFQSDNALQLSNCVESDPFSLGSTNYTNVFIQRNKDKVDQTLTDITGNLYETVQRKEDCKMGMYCMPAENNRMRQSSGSQSSDTDSFHYNSSGLKLEILDAGNRKKDILGHEAKRTSKRFDPAEGSSSYLPRSIPDSKDTMERRLKLEPVNNEDVISGEPERKNDKITSLSKLMDKITGSTPSFVNSVNVPSGENTFSSAPSIPLHRDNWLAEKCEALLDKEVDEDSEHCVDESTKDTGSLLTTSQSQFSISNSTSLQSTDSLTFQKPSPSSCVKLKEVGKKASQSIASEYLAASASAFNGPTKILTKYVFIGKPFKSKSHKKTFGLLYRQAFRHFHGTKVKGIGRKKIMGKIKKITPEVTKKKTTSWKTSSNCPKINKLKKEMENLEKTSLRGQNTRNEAKKAVVESKLSKEVGRISLRQSKKKYCRRQPLSLDEKLAIIKALENSTTTIASIVKEYEVSRTNIWRIVKKKDALLEAKKVEGSVALNRKRKKRSRNNRAAKPSVDVKEEVKEDAREGEEGVAGENMNVFLGDLYPCPSKKSSLRNRRDLTLDEKVQVIKCLEVPGARVRGVARMFGVSSSAISRINKNKEFILLRSLSGDGSANERRSRDCKDPELDRALLWWYRAIEHVQPEETSITISNVLLKAKVHDLAITMGKDFFPSDNWIVRWKHRHNIGSKAKKCSTLVIQNKDELKKFDEKVNIDDILKQLGKVAQNIDQVKREAILKRQEKPEEFIICEHCGVLTSTKKKKQNNHIAGCPSSSSRKDLTLEEKYQVVRALEQPGMKMITLAKKYGVSISAISRINKNRIDILARRASGLANGTRRRDRGSKEPEVERILCEWFKVQNELGFHISGSMIRNKAREIAQVMGKDFWPSESWVFRWRHRNNVKDMNPIFYGDSDEEVEGILQRANDNAEEVAVSNLTEDVGQPGDTNVYLEGDAIVENTDNVEDKSHKKRKQKAVEEGPEEKKFRLPRSVMCEKCGFVSVRVKNKRIKSLRHAKGCPDQKPRNELTYENRAKILKALEEPGATLSSVAREFGISVSSMSRMNQQKERILSHGLDHGGQKRIRDCKEPEVASSLYRWYMEKKAEGIHVTGPKLKERAKKFAAEMGREFNASSGWLGRWRHRYNIIGTVNRGEGMQKNTSLKKKKHKKNTDAKPDSPVNFLQPLPPDLHPDSMGSQTSVIGEPQEPVLPTPQTTTVFLHQRFQNPWDPTQQQTSSCLWTKEFLGPQGPSTQEEHMVPVSYAYSDNVPKPIFHNMFDSFPAMGYQVAMPVDSSMVGRDFLKSDSGEENGAHGSHPSHKPLHSHQQLSHHHHQANLGSQPHLQGHHSPLPHSFAPHPSTHHLSLHPQPPQGSHAPLPSPSPAIFDEDPEQQRQILEAFKIMSSFAAKKSLGGQVQAALRTIEMSMKNSSKKPAPRQTYTSI